MAKKIFATSLWYLLLALAVTGTGRAQSFSLGKFTSLSSTGFDPESKTIYALWKDSIGVYTAPDYTQSRLIRYTRPEPEFPEAYKVIYADSSMYFVHRMGGLVYHLEGDSLRRIDNSFNHRMQINSTIFTRKDTIMRYGGYGFWSTRNFFTYFSRASLEWEVVPPTGSSEVPAGVQTAQIVQDDRYIYTYSGRGLDPFDPLKIIDFRQAWRYDTREHRWEFLGTINEDYHTYGVYAHMGDRILYGDHNSPDLILVDPASNRKTYYERLPRFKNVLARTERNLFETYYADGTFFLLRRRFNGQRNTQNLELYYEVVPESELLASRIREEPLYHNQEFPWKPVGGAAMALGLMFLGYFGLRRYRDRNKVIVSGKEVRYGRQTLDFDATTREVLQLLLRNPEGVYSQQILDLVEKPDLNPAHNIKVKNQLIDSLNFRLKALLYREEDLIESYRSPQDKRIKIYKIKASSFRLR